MAVGGELGVGHCWTHPLFLLPRLPHARRALESQSLHKRGLYVPTCTMDSLLFNPVIWLMVPRQLERLQLRRGDSSDGARDRAVRQDEPMYRPRRQTICPSVAQPSSCNHVTCTSPQTVARCRQV